MNDLKHFNPMKLREKYSTSSLNKTNNYSSFWLNDDWDSTGSIFDEEDVKPKVDLIALSSYRRAIANFVNIVTKKNIPVTFNTSGDSYTDGKKVTISAKLDDKLFDSSVGLALHEGSHILLSDFDFLKQLDVNIPKEYIERGWSKGYSKDVVMSHIKNLLNFVEDRRIDYHIFRNSPGYKGYYHSMYDKYFRAKVVDKALLSDEYTDENWDSYIFRIINLTNSNTRLDSVNGLKDIWNVVNLKNISRLKTTEDAFKTALDIYNVVLNNIPDGTEKTNKETGEISVDRADGSGSTDGNTSSDENNKSEPKELSDSEFSDLLESIEKGEMKEGDGSGSSVSLGGSEDSNSSEEGGSTSSNSKSKSDKVLTEAQKKSLEKAINKQKKFMDGDITKKKVSKKDKASLDAVEAAGMEYREVGKDLEDYYSGKKTPTKVIVVKNFNKELINSDTVDMVSKWQGEHYGDDSYNYRSNETYIEDGIRLGTILGRKLQVRGESRETKYTRKLNGSIDKRLIAELGFGNENVFSKTFLDNYPDAHLHISVDASGSMSGDKWTKTMTSVVAMAKAVDMINNVDLVITFRTTQSGNHSYRSRRDNSYPLLLVAYDSRKDSFIKVRTLFKYLRACGTTPEGLCYEAIMNDMIPSERDKESYFLNFSDGMPMFGNNDIDYHNDKAINHTSKMVKEIRNRGIKVLSYFIGGDWERQDSSSAFNRMYGSDAQFIDVTSVMSVSKTMNKKFLEK